MSLKIAKDGLQIKPAQRGSCVPRPNITPLNEEAWQQFDAARGTKPHCWITTEPVPPNYRDTSTGGSMRQLAEVLSLLAFQPPSSDRPGPLTSALAGLKVLDMTGIPDTEIFDFVLEYGADPDHYIKMGTTPDQWAGPVGPTIFDALKRMGLTLERGKGSREFIVIDRIERPSPN